MNRIGSAHERFAVAGGLPEPSTVLRIYTALCGRSYRRERLNIKKVWLQNFCLALYA
jgi:hypothetical protein